MSSQQEELTLQQAKNTQEIEDLKHQINEFSISKPFDACMLNFLNELGFNYPKAKKALDAKIAELGRKQTKLIDANAVLQMQIDAARFGDQVADARLHFEATGLLGVKGCLATFRCHRCAKEFRFGGVEETLDFSYDLLLCFASVLALIHFAVAFADAQKNCSIVVDASGFNPLVAL